MTTFPVEIDFTPPRKKYAKGGLAAKAGEVERASVGPDTKLIHVNEKEYEWLKSQFGPPVKNPKTGLDTFGFLDFLIPAAASIFLGPAVGGVVGSALGLGETAAGVIGGALAGAGGSALTGGNPLTGALVGGGANYLGLGNGLSSLMGSGAASYGGINGIPASTSVSAEQAAGTGGGILGNLFGTGGQGTSNPLLKAAPYLLMASALGGGEQKQAAPVPLKNDQNKTPLSQVDFNRTQTNPTVNANYGYGPEQSFFTNNALPTMPKPNTVAAAEGKYVKGGGTGTSDSIPAVLSDGEYVMDAQTVSMLGDGSSDAGAAKLDKMREEIRKHKGKALAKGKFAPNAKGPLSYMKRA